VLVVRLYFVQIVHGEDFSAKADRQYIQPSQALYDRGSILFRDEVLSAATLRNGFTVAIRPADILDKEETYKKLAAIVPLDEEMFFRRASKEDDPYEEIANQISEEAAESIEALELPGVELYRERWRYYPGDALAAQAIGFVGFSGDEYSGRYGVERYYDDVLSREGTSVYVNFFAEIFANIGSTIFRGEYGSTGDVVLTIEPSVQIFLERTLREVQEAWHSKQTAGVIINPKSGEVYAMGVYPSFDLNNFGSEESASVFSNPLVESVFEFGSIIKPLTIAAGLDSGAVSRETSYVDKGQITLDGYTISNFDGKARGRVPLQEILNQSLNTGAAFVAAQMGSGTFREYMLEHYRIGDETGIDLPNESEGLVENLGSPRDIEYATASFGQGIAMTPIATVRALSALANGGTLITPHVGYDIRYDTGLQKHVSFKDGDQALAPETSEEITRMLVEVVDEALLGGTVALPDYSIAAKTGTAQIASPDGGYYDDRYLHSFFGYFPAYDAEFLIFLYTLEPKGVRYASQTLTMPFIDTVQYLLNYYDVPPDR